MPCPNGHSRAPLSLLVGLLVIAGLSSCSTNASLKEQERVAAVFASWKTAMMDHHTEEAMSYVSPQVDAYLATLNASALIPVVTATTNQPPSPSPGVDLFLRTALVKDVPADLRSHLTLGALLQRITDRQLFNPHALRQITLGHVSVNGDHANAELYYDDTLTALRLPFIKEEGAWKIDVMTILIDAELLMRLDRAVKGLTVNQQVEQLVSKLPSL
jgi:hypothetical protein